MNRRASINDVAKLANTSISTVSRYLRKNAFVSEDVGERIRLAVKELDYIPNVAGQMLSSNIRDKSIGIVLMCSSEEAFDNPFYGQIIKGIGSIAQKENYYVDLIPARNEQDEYNQCMQRLKSGKVNGLIILRTKKSYRLVEDLLAYNYKFVVCGRVVDEKIDTSKVFTVDTDNIDASEKLVRYLLDAGHRKIGLILDEEDYISDYDRFCGYNLAYMRYGLEVPQNCILKTGRNIIETQDAITAFLLNNPDITAIYARDDYKAYQAIAAAKKMGKKIPENLSIVGFNDYDFSEWVTPALTTNRLDIFKMGVQAGQLLSDIMENREIPNPHIIIKGDFVERNSVAKLI